AAEFHVPFKDRKVARELYHCDDAYWRDDSGRLILTLNDGREPFAFVVREFLQAESWATSLPKPRYIKLSTEPVTEDQIQISDVASFKGLEVDCALLLFSDYTRDFESELYVALSRARIAVALLIRKDKLHLLPQKLRRTAMI